MGKRTGNPRGRPEKPKDEKSITRQITFPPRLWERIEAHAPKGERAAFIQQAVEAALPAEPGEAA